MGALYQPAWTLGQHSSTDGETINSWVIIIIPCSVELNKLSEAMCSFPFRKKTLHNYKSHAGNLCIKNYVT